MKQVKRSLPGEVTLELGLDEPQEPAALRQRLARALGVGLEALPGVILRKRSLDCRRGRVRYHLLFELVPAEVVAVRDGASSAAEPWVRPFL